MLAPPMTLKKRSSSRLNQGLRTETCSNFVRSIVIRDFTGARWRIVQLNQACFIAKNFHTLLDQLVLKFLFVLLSQVTSKRLYQKLLLFLSGIIKGFPCFTNLSWSDFLSSFCCQ